MQSVFLQGQGNTHFLHLPNLEVLQAMGLLVSAISFGSAAKWTELSDGHGTHLKLSFCQFLSPLDITTFFNCYFCLVYFIFIYLCCSRAFPRFQQSLSLALHMQLLIIFSQLIKLGFLVSLHPSSSPHCPSVLWSFWW